MENNKRFIAAMLLSLAILIGWQYIYVIPQHKKIEAAKKKETEKKRKIEAAISKTSKGEKDKIISRSEALTKDKRVKISNGALHGSINLKGGIFDDITIVGFRQEVAKNSPELELLSPRGTNNLYIAEFGWISPDNSVVTPDNNTEWVADKDVLAANDTLVLIWDNGQGVKFIKTISLDNNYMFTVTQSVENNSGKDITVVNFGLVNRAMGKHITNIISHEGPIGVFGGILNEMNYSELKDEKPVEFKDITGWLGIADKYWLTAIIPQEKFGARFSHVLKNKIDRYQVDYLGESALIADGGKVEISQQFFAGAKKIDLIDQYMDQYNIPLFDRAVDFGRLYFLTKPLFFVIKYFYHQLGNFGLAILLLTVIVKILLFPLANKSYRSMAKLKQHMPELQELQARYKGDRMKLSQETMKFYKENNVNPAAGCLPILLQIPIFFALYKVIYISLEMRHAPFYGWIHDLSAPDYTNIFELFGLIQWVPPAWLPAIGILPIIFCATMYIQQMLSPPPTDKTQAMMLRFMPIMFLIILAKAPAGLVIYWIWSNFISILQQLFITKKIKREEQSVSGAKGNII